MRADVASDAAIPAPHWAHDRAHHGGEHIPIAHC